MLVPPAGAKIAILEWEDLECPSCAKAFPFVHSAIRQYNIPLERHDFLIPGHVWSREAALYARYLEDKVSAEMATDYRRQVFASQFRISSREDLTKFTQQFFQSKGKQMPFVVDPTGTLAKEIAADEALAQRMGLGHTPTIVVVTNKGWIEVLDSTMLYEAIDQAKAMAGGPAATTHKATGTK